MKENLTEPPNKTSEKVESFQNISKKRCYTVKSVYPMSPNKHQLRRGGKHVSASEKARKQQECIISESKRKVRKVESDDKDIDFECYDKSDEKPANVDVDKEGSSRKELTLALFPNKSEEVNYNGETGVGNDSRDGNTSVRRSNRKFKPPERLGSIQCF